MPSAMERAQATMAKPMLLVLARDARLAQWWIRELHLGERFRPIYIGSPHGLRGCIHFVVTPEFAERAERRPGEWDEWCWALAWLREQPHTREYTIEELRPA